MPRKPFAKLFSDMGQYVTGHSYIPRHAPQDGDWPYPLNCMFMLEDPDTYFSPQDASGVPMKMLGGGIGTQYLPSRVAAYGFACWQAWQAGDAAARDGFFTSADWFADQKDGVFQHHFALPSVGIKPPWLSCNAQGEGISVLVRAHVVTGEARYLDAARAAFEPLEQPLGNGGLRSTLPDGSPFLEEYPDSAHAHVLNGCLYGMIGLHDLTRIAPDSGADHLLGQLVEAVGANLPAWERGGWSLYQYAPKGSDAPVNYNTPGYQNVHIALLGFMAEASGDARLAAAVARLTRAADSLPKRLMALAGKISYRVRAGW